MGTAVHQQRGEWLISHVHAGLGHAKEALRHAERCFELTESNKKLMQDFDIAYAFEGMARAHAMVGDHKMAKRFLIWLNKLAVRLQMRKISPFLWAISKMVTGTV